MIRVLVALACVLAFVAADHHGTHDVECGILQRIKVKSQWAQVYGHGQTRDGFAHALWKGVYHVAPKVEELFTRVHGDDRSSPEFRAHSLRVLSGFDMTVSMLDDEDMLQAELAHLKGQHVDRHVPVNYYESFGEVLIDLVAQSLGHCADKAAWKACYNHIASGIHD